MCFSQFYQLYDSENKLIKLKKKCLSNCILHVPQSLRINCDSVSFRNTREKKLIREKNENTPATRFAVNIPLFFPQRKSRCCTVNGKSILNFARFPPKWRVISISKKWAQYTDWTAHWQPFSTGLTSISFLFFSPYFISYLLLGFIICPFFIFHCNSRTYLSLVLFLSIIVLLFDMDKIFLL